MLNKYYKIFGLTEECSDSELKKAFRELVKKNHPDLGGNQEDFSKVKEAYQILLEFREKRKKIFPEINEHDFKGIFSNMFSGSNKKFERLDININLEIDIYKINEKTSLQFEYKRMLNTGKEYEIVKENKSVNLIPGFQDKKITLKGIGHQSRITKENFGDVIISIEIINDPPFLTRKGNDIYSEIPVPITRALTGFDIDVMTIHGKKKIHLTPQECFSKNGKTILVGCGLKKSFEEPSYGDHYIYPKIETPAKITKTQKEFLESFPLEDFKKFQEFQKKVEDMQ